MEQIFKMAATGIPLLGSMLSAEASVDQGYAYRTEKRYEANQLEQNARQATAVASHQIADKARMYEVMQSKVLAITGHSGGGVTDNSIVNLIASIAEEGERTSQRIMFGAKDKARIMKEQASLLRFEGDQGVKAARKKAMSTLLAGAGQSATNYLGAGKLINTKTLSGTFV